MTSTRERFAWLDQAACLDSPDWDSRADVWAMLKVCRGCPVRDPCLDAALELDTDGIRGGTLPSQRRVSHGVVPWPTMTDGRSRRP